MVFREKAGRRVAGGAGEEREEEPFLYLYKNAGTHSPGRLIIVFDLHRTLKGIIIIMQLWEYPQRTSSIEYLKDGNMKAI